MSMMDRIYAQMMNEMRDLEEFLNDEDDEHTSLVTQAVTIKYKLNGQSKYLDFSYGQIKQLMEDHARSIRRELATQGKCDAEKS